MQVSQIFCCCFFWLSILSNFWCAIETFSCLRNVCALLARQTIASNDGCILRALKVIIPFQSFQSSFSFFFFFFFWHSCVQVLHTPEKTTIRILSQVIEMPLNQNKSLTPGGKSRGEKTTTDNSESSNVLIWRSLRVYSGRSCRTETTAGANRIRLRKREKERKKEEKKNQANKRKRNETKQMA